MIANEKQYKITKKTLGEVQQKISVVKSNKDNELKKVMMLASLENFEEDLTNELIQYETLKKGKVNKLKERNLSQLPSLITEYKIANNLTQKDLSKQLGLKEQQLQRYEAEGFKTVSFQNLVKFLDLMKLELTIKATPLKRRKTKSSTLQP